jgi:Amidohydrolase family
MKFMRRWLFATAFFSMTVADAAEPTLDDRAHLHWIRQEVEIAGALDDLSRRAISGFIAFKDVSIVDPKSGAALPGRTVAIRDGKIAWVGEAAAAPDLGGATIIDGHALYLSPGLVDMHVHSTSLSEQLLRLATGNTSVREMDGFPWMLEFRRAVVRGSVLAPTDYIAGTIIASYPLDGYSVVIHTPDEARSQVRNQAACGYDFIKVHNILKPSLFDSVADEARRAGLDLTGHVPHDITIDHAVHFGGMRTLEHLKGFISDRTLVVSDEDFAAGLAGAHVWLTPTFYAITEGHRVANARQSLSLPEMKYVALRNRQQWQKAEIDPHDAKAQALLDTAIPLAMARLLPLHPHWLAGTDSAQYPFQVAGFALLDELVNMEQFGIPRAEVLRSATSEPAMALHRADEFGSVEIGMRADLVILGSDPMQDLHAYRDNRGTVVRGVFLDHAALQSALSRLAAIEAEPDADYRISTLTADALIKDVQRLAAHHIALDPKSLAPAEASLAQLGYSKTAAELKTLVSQYERGPCAEILPEGGG